MLGTCVRAVAFAALAAASALAEDGVRPPEPLTPHYSVQQPPERQESAGPVAQRPPVAAPTPQVEQAALNEAARSHFEPDETVRVTGLRPSDDDSYRLGAGDKLRLIVFGEEDLSGNFEVDGQGYVRLPLIGQVVASGLTTYGLEERIKASFIGGGYLISPKVSVEVTGYRPFYIIGEVAKPGEYPYVNAMSALNAIALAGGFTDRAVTDSLYVRRVGEVDEREVVLGATTHIRPGDVVRVRRSTYWAVMTVLAPLISPFSAVAYLLK